jgi:surfactin synthase thioesterase subunit
MTAAGTHARPLGPRQVGPLGCSRPQPEATARLVCFAHAGGGPGSYLKWQAALGPEVEVWTVALPGRANRSDEGFVASWPELADELAAAVVDLGDQAGDQAGGASPALLGHSLGGLVAYEVALELERRGSSPRHVFVSGGRAPHRLGGHWRLPVDDDALLTEVDRRYGAVPAAVRAEPALLARFVPALRADLELAASYVWTPGERLRSPITALAGADDKTGPPEEAQHWREHTDGGFRAVTFPGAHFFVHSELRAVAGVIRAALAP